MAVKQAYFTALNGKQYIVALATEKGESGEIKLAGESPVVISMSAGERKFVGFKSQTCKVKIVTDTPMLELYGNRATSATLVVREGVGDVLFDGYVVPFAYSQPYSGCCDVIEIEAVDRITARKEVAYTNFGEPYGTDRSGLAIVQEICYRAGVYKIVEHINFSEVNFTGESPLNIPVAQAGFLQEEVGEVDVLSAICKFFGYTGHVFGSTLYLYDEHYLTHSDDERKTDANVYECSKGVWSKKTTYHAGEQQSRVVQGGGLDLSPLSAQGIYMGDGILSGVTLNVERAYDGVQITPEGSDTSILLPDVCADENLEDYTGELGSATRTFQNKTKDVDYIQYRTPRKSKLIDFGLVQNGQITDDWDSIGGDPVIENTWQDGAMCLDVTHVNRKRYRNYADQLDIIATNIAKSGNMVWMKGRFNESTTSAKAIVGKQRGTARYSHTDGDVKISLDCTLMRWGNWIDITSPDEQRAADGTTGSLELLRLVCGSKLYKRGGVSPWVNDDGGMSEFYTDGNSTTLLPTVTSLSRLTNEIVAYVPENGQIYAELGWVNKPAVIYSSQYGEGWNIYLNSLSIEGYGDAVNLESEDMRHDYVTEPMEYIEAKTMLTTRLSHATEVNSSGKNARPSVVPATNWVGGYMARSSEESIPISGILMEQLRERYGEPHTAYTMTVGKLLYPYKPTAYEGKKYTIESYDLDLYNTETTVTIN